MYTNWGICNGDSNFLPITARFLKSPRPLFIFIYYIWIKCNLLVSNILLQSNKFIFSSKILYLVQIDLYIYKDIIFGSKCIQEACKPNQIKEVERTYLESNCYSSERFKNYLERPNWQITAIDYCVYSKKINTFCYQI
jgi:hypothetical protein